MLNNLRITNSQEHRGINIVVLKKYHKIEKKAEEASKELARHEQQ